MSTGHANNPKDRSPSIRNQLCDVSRLPAGGVGHCAAIGAAGTFPEMVQCFLNWNEPSKRALWRTSSAAF